MSKAPYLRDLVSAYSRNDDVTDAERDILIADFLKRNSGQVEQRLPRFCVPRMYNPYVFRGRKAV